MNKSVYKILILPTIFMMVLPTFSCNKNRHDRRDQIVKKPAGYLKQDNKIDKVVFFLENSGSMFGYVSRPNDFKTTIVGLSYLPEFDEANKSFYFINGTSNPIKNTQVFVHYIGDNPEILKNNLNQESFGKIGNKKYSDLTRMFEITLDSAKGNRISILVSDCIYDVGEEVDPLTSLVSETQKTEKLFRQRLEKEDIETLLIKAYSKFDGYYSFASKKGEVHVPNEYRPYYILIFGRTELLNKYLSENSIGNKIAGHYEIARFLTINESDIPYQITTSIDRKGNFKRDLKVKNKLKDVSPDGKGQGFQFSIAVDLSSLPYKEDYKTSKANYSCNMNYRIVNIRDIMDNEKYEVTDFPSPTNIISVHTDKNPLGNLEIVLKNEVPNWLKETDIDNETRIDSLHTFGFMPLMDAISNAYAFRNKGKNLANFKIEISK